MQVFADTCRYGVTSPPLRLVKKAEQEGVSLNTLVIAMIAEALGKNKASHYK